MDEQAAQEAKLTQEKDKEQSAALVAAYGGMDLATPGHLEEAHNIIKEMQPLQRRAAEQRKKKADTDRREAHKVEMRGIREEEAQRIAARMAEAGTAKEGTARMAGEEQFPATERASEPGVQYYI